ncbi:unnamed protein product [Pleuronectes platessa]|uniref:Uncharacterized protein n=1 Tax=Pleuronectes platessa TaxID=8262 RepID=A0A9N7YYT5_PLEPL|nr:unnamed protein product [Pleuronectes platessa]
MDGETEEGGEMEGWRDGEVKVVGGSEVRGHRTSLTRRSSDGCNRRFTSDLHTKLTRLPAAVVCLLLSTHRSSEEVIGAQQIPSSCKLSGGRKPGCGTF